MREQNDPNNIIIVLISSNFVEMTVENFVLCKSNIGGVKYHQYLLLYLPKIATKLYGPARCKEDVLLSFQLAGLGKIFVLRFICWQYCINYRNFISFSSVKILWKHTVSSEFRVNLPKLCRNYTFFTKFPHQRISWNDGI